MAARIILSLMVLICFIMNRVLGVDIKKTDIKVVTDENRYFTLNPNASYITFDKDKNAKGNIVFCSGERIDGDRLLLTFNEEAQFARSTDIEVSLCYPAEGQEGKIISYVEFVTHLSTTDAETYFVNHSGIGQTSFEILMVANHTFHFGYQMYLFGY